MELNPAVLAAQAKHKQSTTGAQITVHTARVHTNCRKHARGHWQFTVHRGRRFPGMAVHNNMSTHIDDNTTNN